MMQIVMKMFRLFVWDGELEQPDRMSAQYRELSNLPGLQTLQDSEPALTHRFIACTLLWPEVSSDMPEIPVSFDEGHKVIACSRNTR